MIKVRKIIPLWLTGLVNFFVAWSSSGAGLDRFSDIITEKDNLSVLEHVKTLSSDYYSGRKLASQGNIDSQDYLVTSLKADSIPAFNNQYRHSFTKSSFFQSKQGTNIIGCIQGTHHKDKYIVLTAHYDHLGTIRNKIYNGADDNASGTAALLLYAKLLKDNPLKHSVILLFTDGEEVDLLGAKAFISQQKKLLNNVKLNINLDMIAGSKNTKKLRFLSKDLPKILSSQQLDELNQLQAYFKKNSLTQLTAGFRRIKSVGSNVNRANWLMASDHGVFSKAGIPFVYFGVGTHKNYHSELDDYDKINKNLYLAAISVIFQQLVYIDNAMYEVAIPD
ncbi:M20/M25/M40 family metallo-hydrolase [Colwellia psychrerythraea]|uniref:Peptidase M28 n=1 Tax=Colwellia psychrerythraea TaxID=28229 RepID=A0A099KEA1_COLPS|nr:M20/M25/M40 family metallo-hydrolase [Colwellia psychrerythraea]KGJ88656.1 peptidase M28 [Colwellia psychrerythraea]